MPLIKGKSKKAFDENMESEMDAGKPQNQSLAIAYNMKRKARKMAEGGMIGSHQPPGQGHTVHINVHPQAEYDPMEHPAPERNSMSMEEDDKGLNQHHVDEMMMAEGGEMGHQSEDHDMDMVGRIMHKREQMYSQGGKVANENSGESTQDPHSFAKADPNEFDDLALRDDLSSEYTGENSGDEDGSDLNQDDDMVGRIMRKRASKK